MSNDNSNNNLSNIISNNSVMNESHVSEFLSVPITIPKKNANLELYFHECIDNLLGFKNSSSNAPSTDNQEFFQKLFSVYMANTNIPNNTTTATSVQYDKTITKKIIQQYVENYNNNNTDNPISPESTATILIVFGGRFSELYQYSQSKSAEICNNYLKDFDWSVRLITNSDKIHNMRKPVCLLNLNIENQSNNNSKPQSSIPIELSSNELDTLLRKCEEINKIAQQVKI